MPKIHQDLHQNKLWVDSAGVVWYRKFGEHEKPEIKGAVTEEDGLKVYNDIRKGLQAFTEWGLFDLLFREPIDVFTLQDADTHASYAIEADKALEHGSKQRIDGSFYVVVHMKHWSKL